MILDIAPWKSELKSIRNMLEAALVQNDDFNIEKGLYFSAIILRKLMDNRLAPPNMGTENMAISIYEPASGALDGLNYLDARAHYQLDHGEAGQASYKRVVDIVVHSSFLDWRISNSSAIELFMSSDRERKAIGVPCKRYLKMLDDVIAAEFRAFPLPTAKRTS